MMKFYTICETFTYSGINVFGNGNDLDTDIHSNNI